MPNIFFGIVRIQDDLFCMKSKTGAGSIVTLCNIAITCVSFRLDFFFCFGRSQNHNFWYKNVFLLRRIFFTVLFLIYRRTNFIKTVTSYKLIQHLNGLRNYLGKNQILSKLTKRINFRSFI